MEERNSIKPLVSLSSFRKLIPIEKIKDGGHGEITAVENLGGLCGKLSLRIEKYYYMHNESICA